MDHLRMIGTPESCASLENRIQAVLPHTHIQISRTLGSGTYGTCFAARLPLAQDSGDIVLDAQRRPIYTPHWCALKVFDVDKGSRTPSPERLHYGSSSDEEEEDDPRPLDKCIAREVHNNMLAKDCLHVVTLRARTLNVQSEVCDPLVVTPQDLNKAADTDPVLVGPFMVPDPAVSHPPMALSTRVFIMPLWRLDLYQFQSRAIKMRLTTTYYYQTVMRIMHQIATAVHELHQKNIVHLDIKPGNVRPSYSVVLGASLHAAADSVGVHKPQVACRSE